MIHDFGHRRSNSENFDVCVRQELLVLGAAMRTLLLRMNKVFKTGNTLWTRGSDSL